jgi:hypothetical protein
VAIALRTKTVVSLAIRCHRSVNQSLSWTGQMRVLASLHSITSSSCITLATTIHNKKYLAPLVLALALAERVEVNKRLCREIASDEASKKTSLT